MCCISHIELGSMSIKSQENKQKVVKNAEF